MSLGPTIRMILTLTLLGLALAHGPGVFRAENPRVQLEAGQAYVYATLVNQENKAVKVIAADSPVAQRVELRQGNNKKSF
jgi:copper(I)-binding protein